MFNRLFRYRRSDAAIIKAALDAYGWPPPTKTDEHIDRLIAALNAAFDRERRDGLSL